MFRPFISFFLIFLLLCLTSLTEKSYKEDISFNVNHKDSEDYLNYFLDQKIIYQGELKRKNSKVLFDSLYFLFKNYKYGNHPAYAQDLSSYLLEDGIKMMYWSHTDEKHFFKFEDMEQVFITSYNVPNHHYRLIIKDKSEHTNVFPDCVINNSNLLNIYFTLKTYIKSLNPNAKTRFMIDPFYQNEVEEHNEWMVKLKKKSELAQKHNKEHINSDTFLIICEFCRVTMKEYRSSPFAMKYLQDYFKNWIFINNRNFSIHDNTNKLSDYKIFDFPWNSISKISSRPDGSPKSYYDSTTSKRIQKYIFRFTNLRGQYIEYPANLFEGTDVDKRFINIIVDYQKKFKKRPLVNYEVVEPNYH